MRTVAALVGATALVSAGSIMAQTPSATPQQPTVQQAFDEATALSAAGKWAEALVAYRALEPRVGTLRSKAIVQLRQAKSLVQLGRSVEARPMLVAALKALPEGDDSLREDRLDALFTIGALDSVALDYASAYSNYGLALRLASDDGNKGAALIGLIQTGTYVDPEGTLAHVEAVQALLATAKLDGRSRALIEVPVAQYFLNVGRFKEAKDVASRAVSHLGGLMTEKMDLMDAAARSDVALAALKLGDNDTAREFLARSGIGVSKQGFNGAAAMQPPLCGGEAGLRPEDMAIVEFWVGDDGTVIRAAPVYASRPGEVGLAFARAVQDWWWKPEDLKLLPAFFRYNVRVELRCSSAFPRPPVTAEVDQGLAEWLEEKHVVSPLKHTDSDVRRLPGERAALAAADAKGEGSALSTVPLLFALLSNTVVPRDERARFAERAVAILDANQAPPIARLGADLYLWSVRAPSKRSDPRAPGKQNDIGWSYVQELQAGLETPRYASDPLARAALRLILADILAWRDAAATAPLLRAIAEDSALEDGHPLKVGALIRLASLEKKAGNMIEARAAFDRTGLTGEQCAMLDAPPRMTATGVDRNSFPQEAQRWGFEGWVSTQFDIDARGETHGQRAIVAYPPFVFTDSATGLVTKTRFAATYRPGDTLGCGSFTQRVSYDLPR